MQCVKVATLWQMFRIVWPLLLEQLFSPKIETGKKKNVSIITQTGDLPKKKLVFKLQFFFLEKSLEFLWC